ncbi:MAG TPA: hypothetical protein VFJ91_12550 [Gaiellaceae bacterium]|nr:hypothetical protein [Gaiellaceae bacterium]
MRASRTAALAIAAPVLVYVAILALVAGFVTHPPLVGWIGLAVVAALGAALAAGLSLLFPRMRANVEPAAAPERERLLVLADASCPGERLCDTVAARIAGRRAEVLVVAPVLASPLHYLAGDEDAETREAQARLDAVLAGLRRRGLHAQGRLGSDDPLQSLGDALAGFPAGEALVVTSPAAHWLEPGLFERARRLVPVLEHVEAA